uniref:DNA 3'-5' helicase n=1 Tax=Serinus canaria TaxID=9135 RepID=A0A8C9MKN6_SERCA
MKDPIFFFFFNPKIPFFFPVFPLFPPFLIPLSPQSPGPEPRQFRPPQPEEKNVFPRIHEGKIPPQTGEKSQIFYFGDSRPLPRWNFGIWDFFSPQVWKQKWRKKFGGGADVCFRCGGKGHWASECRENNSKFLLLNPTDPPEEVLEALRSLGYDSFRPGQAEAVMRVLSGISTLLLLPTGSGKSLCYQLPAFLYHRRSRCISLVISPLVSLMDDQVSGLPSPLQAVCIHSNLTPSQREAAIQKVRSGQAQILLLSPESVTGSGFFYRFFRHFPPVAFACLDEAHCISQWSHNFRPAYLRVCKVLRERLGVRCFLGLTATATVATARDVAKHLGIPEGNSAIGTFGIPENLRLSVSVEADQDQGVLRVLREWRRESAGGSVLIHCSRREQSESLAAKIRTEFPEIPGEKPRKGNLGIPGTLEFDAVALSDSMGGENWECRNVPGTLGIFWELFGIFSGIQVEFWEFSFHFRARGDLSPLELDSLTEFLNSQGRKRERAELRRLQSCLQTLHRSQFPTALKSPKNSSQKSPKFQEKSQKIPIKIAKIPSKILKKFHGKIPKIPLKKQLKILLKITGKNPGKNSQKSMGKKSLKNSLGKSIKSLEIS